MKKDILNSSFVVSMASTIEEAMGAITDNQRGAVFVVDAKGHLIGVLADGDIRRAMLGGAMLQTPVEKIVNLNPITLTEREVKAGKGDEIFQEEMSFTLLPVVGAGNVLVDILVREPKKRKPW